MSSVLRRSSASEPGRRSTVATRVRISHSLHAVRDSTLKDSTYHTDYDGHHICSTSAATRARISRRTSAQPHRLASYPVQQKRRADRATRKQEQLEVSVWRQHASATRCCDTSWFFQPDDCPHGFSSFFGATLTCDGFESQQTEGSAAAAFCRFLSCQCNRLAARIGGPPAVRICDIDADDPLHQTTWSVTPFDHPLDWFVVSVPTGSLLLGAHLWQCCMSLSSPRIHRDSCTGSRTSSLLDSSREQWALLHSSTPCGWLPLVFALATRVSLPDDNSVFVVDKYRVLTNTLWILPLACVAPCALRISFQHASSGLIHHRGCCREPGSLCLQMCEISEELIYESESTRLSGGSRLAWPSQRVRPLFSARGRLRAVLNVTTVWSVGGYSPEPLTLHFEQDPETEVPGWLQSGAPLGSIQLSGRTVCFGRATVPVLFRKHPRWRWVAWGARCDPSSHHNYKSLEVASEHIKP